jgi:hypothetical protein
MATHSITAISARFRQSSAKRSVPRLGRPSLGQRLLILAALAFAYASGCAAGAPEASLGDAVETDAEIASAEAALIRGSGGSSLGFTCTNGKCTCDKSIENDCEDMSGVCSDDTVDDLINCIEGWLTTDCICTLAIAAPRPQVQYTAPIGTFNVLAR